MRQPTVLLTGFEPYGGRGVNPSHEVMRRLDGVEIAGARIAGRAFPVSLRPLAQLIGDALRETEPVAVVSLGLWPGEAMLRLERIGLNLADFEIADNEGTLVVDAAIEGNGPAARRATLPLRAIETALLEAGIPVRISNTAGAYLCNATLFGFLQALDGLPRKVPCGFIHLPYLPAQVATMLSRPEGAKRTIELHQRADLASMDLETQVRAVEIAVRVTLEAAGK